MEKRLSIENPSAPLIIFSLLTATATIFAILFMDLVGAAIMIALPAVVWVIVSVFRDPRLGMITLFVANYFVMGISRYVPGPLGLAIDGLLVVTYVAALVRSLRVKGLLARANRDLTLLAVIWYLYAIFELFNPEAQSRMAWLFAMRGFSLYFVLTIPLTFMLLNRRRDLNLILTLWSVFTLLAVAKGLVQLYGFLDSAELQWLADGGAKTHIVGGRLRVFSFFTDAGQYGASMGYSGVVFAIAAIGTATRRTRYYYLFVSLMAFMGMMLSGTRGAIAIPAAAVIMFMVISGNRRYIITTAVVAISLFVFFKYTYIGNNNYQISRMRTAFTGKDASLQARLDNQAKLSTYLASRPFGGGIGSAGNWGQRFSPNGFLAQVPTDSWYVSIWAEQGVVGLTLHLFILFYVLIKGAILVRRVRDPELSFQLKGLLCGMAGIMAASYGNGVMGQMPTGIILYMSMAFMFMAKELDNESCGTTNT